MDTHFADPEWAARTLCGRSWDTVIMNARPATCERCREAHAADGWTFPLPPTVSSE